MLPVWAAFRQRVELRSVMHVRNGLYRKLEQDCFGQVLVRKFNLVFSLTNWRIFSRSLLIGLKYCPPNLGVRCCHQCPRIVPASA